MGALSALKHKAPAKYGNELICQLQSLQIPVCMYVAHTHTLREKQIIYLRQHFKLQNCLWPNRFAACQLLLLPTHTHTDTHTHTHTHTATYVHSLHFCVISFFVGRNKTESFMAFMWFYLLLLPCASPPFPSLLLSF